MALNLPQGTDAKFQVNEPVLAGEVLYTATGERQIPGSAPHPSLRPKNELLWEIDADGTGDLIQAGKPTVRGWRRFDHGDRSARPGGRGAGGLDPTSGWRRVPFGGGSRPAVRRNARWSYSGVRRRAAGTRTIESSATPTQDADAAKLAERLLKATGKHAGYALWFGIENGNLLEAVAAASDLHLVGIDPDAQKIDRLRRQFDQGGWYGRRVALQVGEMDKYMAPPYMAELIVVERSAVPVLRKPGQLARLYESLRPYGGKLVILTDGWANSLTADASVDGVLADGLELARDAAVLEQAKVAFHGNTLVISRQGPLPGSAPWTHAYGTWPTRSSRTTSACGCPWGCCGSAAVRTKTCCPGMDTAPANRCWAAGSSSKA
jgi:hypothetical protein